MMNVTYENGQNCKIYDFKYLENKELITKIECSNKFLVELVERYNLVEFYNEIYLKKQKTVEGCAICCDNKFIQYIKCQNNHVICRECYDLCQNKRLCCVCRNEYQIKNMYYEKLKN